MSVDFKNGAGVWTPPLFSSLRRKRIALWGYLPLAVLSLGGLIVQPYFGYYAWAPFALSVILLPLLGWSSHRESTRAAFASLLAGAVFCVWVTALSIINLYAAVGRPGLDIQTRKLILLFACAESLAIRGTTWALVGILAGWLGIHASRPAKSLFAWVALFSGVAAIISIGVGMSGGWLVLQPWTRWAAPCLLAVVGLAGHLHLRMVSAPQARGLLVTFHCVVMLAALSFGVYFHGVFSVLHDTGPVGIGVTFIPDFAL